MVALGATFSALWIVVANSWMNTPAGHQIVVHDGVPRAEGRGLLGDGVQPVVRAPGHPCPLGAYILGAFS